MYVWFQQKTSSRTPHGVRGLKYRLRRLHVVRTQSHPSRGAWIEILNFEGLERATAGRTPHGVRGLKFSYASPAHGIQQVAPLTGCVD